MRSMISSHKKFPATARLSFSAAEANGYSRHISIMHNWTSLYHDLTEARLTDQSLSMDRSLAGHLPLKENSSDIFEKITDGIILCYT